MLDRIALLLATGRAVHVMARMREQHDRGASNEQAAAIASAGPAAPALAAAPATAIVFLAFAVSKGFFMKQIAIAEAAAVLIDTTVVRALLAPALMGLFGEWNRWAPRPLRRIHARFRFAD